MKGNSGPFFVSADYYLLERTGLKCYPVKITCNRDKQDL